MDNSKSLLFTENNIGPITLRNRTIRSAAFEGMCDENRPSEMLLDYHSSVSQGGVGMSTVAYAAVMRSGLSFPHQLWIRPDILRDLRDVTDAIHAGGAKASIQLGHCGNMSKKEIIGETPWSPSGRFNLYAPTFTRAMTNVEIRETALAFGEAVRMARDSGFDCVEIHAGHGYLISQFLSPYTNKRKDKYGGSLDNRMKFMRMCMSEVMSAAESDMGVVVKMNMRDGFKGGMEIDDCITVAKELQELGAHALVLSGGFVSKAPMYVMRGKMPITTLSYYMDKKWLSKGVKMFGNIMIPKCDFKELYFREDALKFHKALPDMPLIYVGGCVSRDGIDTVLNDGFQFVQIGRALINEPDFVNRMKAGEQRCGCDHVNYCIARMYSMEMACHKHCTEELPKKILQEIENIQKYNEHHK